MDHRQIKRVSRELTDVERARLANHRQRISDELSDLQARDQMRQEATLSGELRRAVHESQLSLAALAAQVGITPVLLDDFLTGERTLRSDVIERLAGALGYELQRGK